LRSIGRYSIGSRLSHCAVLITRGFDHAIAVLLALEAECEKLLIALQEVTVIEKVEVSDTARQRSRLLYPCDRSCRS
jgi:hypothetical protein